MPSPKTKAKVVKLVPIGTLIDTLHNQREAKRALESDVKKIEEKIAELTAQIIERLDADKTDRAGSKRATVSISEHVIGVPKDWERFMEEEVRKKGNVQLVERRVSALACREIWERGGSIQGVEPFTKRTLNLRTVKE